MWLLCDAGWARIERMALSSGEVIAGSVRRTALPLPRMDCLTYSRSFLMPGYWLPPNE